jgi:hypothetical protein
MSPVKWLGAASLALLLAIASTASLRSSDYMNARPTEATLRYTDTGERCGKHSCEQIYYGVFALAGGALVQKEVSLFAYKDLVAGERYTVGIRGNESAPSSGRWALYFLLPFLGILLGGTGTIIFSLIALLEDE